MPTLELEICCPNCENDTRLQSTFSMFDGTVYEVCPCGFVWEVQKKAELVN